MDIWATENLSLQNCRLASRAEPISVGFGVTLPINQLYCRIVVLTTTRQYLAPYPYFLNSREDPPSLPPHFRSFSTSTPILLKTYKNPTEPAMHSLDSGIHLSSSYLLDNKSTSSAAANSETLLGKCIASVLDLKPQMRNAEQEKELGQKADLLAEVFADGTCMTRMSMPKAACLRSLLLLKVQESPQGCAEDFASNFAEGAVLNRLTVALNPLYAQRKLSIGRELSNHFLAGGGIASTKACFHKDTWQDNSNPENLDLKSGIKRVAEATLLGGLSNVPASFAAARIFHSGALSNRFGDIWRATGCGATAGSISSGVQTFLSGQNDKIFSAMAEGTFFGAAGAASSAALMRSNYFANKPRIILNSDTNQYKARTKFDPAQYRETDVVKSESSSLLERAAEVENAEYDVKEMRVKYVKDDVQIEKLKTEEEFQKKAVKTVKEAARVYKLRGLEVWIPENYASQLDDVLRMRLIDQHPEKFTDLTLDEYDSALQFLHDHPLRNRAHLADLLPAMRYPNPKLVRKVIISPELWVNDKWEQINDPWTRDNPGMKALATAHHNGDMVWYQPTLDNDNYQTGMHEWSHLLHFRSSQRTATAWVKAALLEKNFFISDYAKRDYWENFAEHSANFLNPDFKSFNNMVRKAPIRSAVINDTMADSYRKAQRREIVPAGLEQLGARLDFVYDEVTPLALKRLSNTFLHSANQRKAARAADLLAEFGGPDELELLSKSKDADPFIRRSARRAAQKLNDYLVEDGTLAPADSK